MPDEVGRPTLSRRVGPSKPFLDEIAAGRIPYRHRQIEGWQIPLKHFFPRHQSIRHEVAVDNAVIRTGPVMILAANARGEMEHILDLTQSRPSVYTRMSLVLLDTMPSCTGCRRLGPCRNQR